MHAERENQCSGDSGQGKALPTTATQEYKHKLYLKPKKDLFFLNPNGGKQIYQFYILLMADRYPLAR